MKWGYDIVMSKVDFSGVNFKNLFDKDSIEYALFEKAFNAGRAAEREELKKAESEELKKKKEPDFKKVEKLLYAYPDLKYKIELDKQEIKKLEAVEFPDSVKKGKSKDIVMMPSGGCSKDEYANLELLIQSKKASMERTIREVEKIDNALERVKYLNDEKSKRDTYFRIIELKYFKSWNDDDISKELKCDPSTIRRNKNRIINRLKNILI